MIRLLWTLAVSGAVIALGVVLVLRWLGAAGVPAPLRGQSPISIRYEADRKESAAVFAAALFSRLGYQVYPAADALRTDIIQAVKLGTPAGLCAFCQGVQRGAPVDAFVTPEPWDMPGYDSQVIMAVGAFTMGASIELSADGPMREPYAAWLQGGITWPSGKAGVLLAAQSLLEAGELHLEG